MASRDIAGGCASGLWDAHIVFDHAQEVDLRARSEHASGLMPARLISEELTQLALYIRRCTSPRMQGR